MLWRNVIVVFLDRLMATSRYLRCSALLFACSLTLAQADASLFQRLGGERVLKPVVHRLIVRAHREKDTKRSFKDTDLKRIEDKLYEQICQLAQGPCTYTGDEMKLVHGGLQISEREFYTLVQQLREELDRARVGSAEKNELLALLAPFKKDVVTIP